MQSGGGVYQVQGRSGDSAVVDSPPPASEITRRRAVTRWYAVAAVMAALRKPARFLGVLNANSKTSARGCTNECAGRVSDQARGYNDSSYVERQMNSSHA